MVKSRKVPISIIGLIIVVIAGVVFFRFKNKTVPAPLLSAVAHNSTLIAQQTSPDSTTTPAPLPSTLSTTPATANVTLPAEVNLNVPFTSQAPNQKWDATHEQFCEEASILMAASYSKNQTINGPDDAETKLQAIKKFEIKRLGYYEDTTAEETALILREYFKLASAEAVSNPTIDDIKTALASNKVVIVPLAGRQIGNPNFTPPGPLYHMLVIKGYTKNGDFVTNDPGTHKGADYIYKQKVIMDAIHDWNGGKVDVGGNVMIIVG